MTTHEQAFLQAILESPDDDGLRLTYADYLEGRGDQRGEFIRVQIALAGVVDDQPCPECRWGRPHREGCRILGLQRRGRELLGAHGREWLPAVLSVDPSGWQYPTYHSFGAGWSATFRRGFVEAITLPANSLLAHGDAIVAAAPIAEVTLTTWPEVEMQVYDGSGPMATIRGVKARYQPSSAEHESDMVRHLLRAEWPRVKKWNLPGGRCRHCGDPLEEDAPVTLCRSCAGLDAMPQGEVIRGGPDPGVIRRGP